MRTSKRSIGSKLSVTGVSTFCVSVSFLALSSVAVAADVSKDQAMASCDAAQSAVKAAAEVQMEWRDTGKLIKSGLALIEEGDFAGAMKKCDQGKFQGDAGVEQARLEAERWQARVPKS